jgi:hypothetical protein
MIALFWSAQAQRPPVDPSTPKPTPPAEALPAPADIGPDARIIIDKYIEATGGRSGWAKVKTIQGNGSVAIPAANINGTATFAMGPDAFRRRFNISGGPMIDAMIENGRVGDIVWQLTGERDQYNGKIIEGAERARQLRMYQFNHMLDLEKNFIQVAVVDVAQVEGDVCMKLLMVPRDFPETKEYRYFDQKTNLIRQTDMVGVNRPPQTSRFSGYRQVGPVKIHSDTKIMANEQVIMLIAIPNLTVNQPLPSDIRELPLEIKVLLGIPVHPPSADE